MASIRKILPPQPHYLTGYTGFVPGLKFHCGETYGRLTNTLFLDQRIKRSKKLVLLELGKPHEEWVSKEDKEALQNRCHDNKECRYTEDMVIGYTGHVPQYRFQDGHK
ncbi:protein FAM166B-like [Sipha flava]|jgi:hypothetical protein|uniref:Protein FAM166B-like n=1 Tax=Sipha flava TaxID=143950 RepID=A0A2S2PYN6_9HEMI|nr:protein FAM166B-like [Sipha flava]